MNLKSSDAHLLAGLPCTESDFERDRIGGETAKAGKLSIWEAPKPRCKGTCSVCDDKWVGVVLVCCRRSDTVHE